MPDFPDGLGGPSVHTDEGGGLNIAKIIGFIPRRMYDEGGGIILYQPVSEGGLALQYVEHELIRQSGLGEHVADLICQGYKVSMRPTFDMESNPVLRGSLSIAHRVSGVVSQFVAHMFLGFGERYEHALNNVYDGMISPDEFNALFRQGAAASTRDVYKENAIIYDGKLMQGGNRPLTQLRSTFQI